VRDDDSTDHDQRAEQVLLAEKTDEAAIAREVSACADDAILVFDRIVGVEG